MRPLAEREKRTIRIAAIGIAVYLGLFYGHSIWQHLEAKRFDYQQLLQEAQTLEHRLQSHANKRLRLEALEKRFGIDPSGLSRQALAADASAAVQKAAKESGLELGAIRESSRRASAHEVAAIQFQGNGDVESLVSLLHRLRTLGLPLILESVDIQTGDRPGSVNLNCRLVILDFEQWEPEEARDV